MTSVRCARCGVAPGPASRFARGLCGECFAASKTRSQNWSAVAHLLVLIAGVLVFVTEREGLLAYFLFLFALLDVIGFVVTVVHETAHALIASLVGFEVVEVSIGIGPQVGRVRVGTRRHLVFRLLPLGGQTTFAPSPGRTRLKGFLTIAAGPVSHLPFALWLNSLLPLGSGWDPFIDISVRFVLILGLINLLPIANYDGRRLIEYLVMPQQRVESLVSLGGAINAVRELVDPPGEGSKATDLQREAFLAHLANPAITIEERAISLNNLAAVDLLLEDPDLIDEADAAASEAIELMPDNASIRNTRGSVLVTRGEFEAGIALLHPTLGRIPPHAVGNTHGLLAFAHLSLGRVFEGRIHLTAARQAGFESWVTDRARRMAGQLEVEVIRRFAEGRSPEETARVFRADAGPVATTTGTCLLAHIEATGLDRDLTPIATLLAG